MPPTTSQSSPVRIERSDTIRYRWGCPRGHTNWEARERTIWCQSCARSHLDVDPEHEQLLDKATDRHVSVADVEIVDG